MAIDIQSKINVCFFPQYVNWALRKWIKKFTCLKWNNLSFITIDYVTSWGTYTHTLLSEWLTFFAAPKPFVSLFTRRLNSNRVSNCVIKFSTERAECFFAAHHYSWCFADATVEHNFTINYIDGGLLKFPSEKHRT